jgi:hypothetical protein
MRKVVEPLLHAAKVNAVFAGHVHAYERSNLAYNMQNDPTGAMHVTIGDGGNREGLYTSWVTPTPAWSAFHKSEYGSGTLTFYNASVAEWQWHMNSADESVVADSFVLNNIAA